MIRLTRALPVAAAAVVLLAACSSEAPQGATLPPLTTAVSTTTETTGSATTESSASSSAETTPESSPVESSGESSPVESSAVESSAVESVPTEASALPLPTEQINVPADSPQEEADRAAIEAVWRQVWDLTRRGYDISDDEARAEASTIMIDPVASRILDGMESGRERGLGTYGEIVDHPYWYRSISGLPYAAMGDCGDFSNFGEKDGPSGQELSRGTAGVNRVGIFAKQSDGSWRLSDIKNVEQECAA